MIEGIITGLISGTAFEALKKIASLASGGRDFGRIKKINCKKFNESYFKSFEDPNRFRLDTFRASHEVMLLKEQYCFLYLEVMPETSYGECLFVLPRLFYDVWSAAHNRYKNEDADEMRKRIINLLKDRTQLKKIQDRSEVLHGLFLSLSRGEIKNVLFSHCFDYSLFQCLKNEKSIPDTIMRDRIQRYARLPFIGMVQIDRYLEARRALEILSMPKGYRKKVELSYEERLEAAQSILAVFTLLFLIQGTLFLARGLLEKSLNLKTAVMSENDLKGLERPILTTLKRESFSLKRILKIDDDLIPKWLPDIKPIQAELFAKGTPEIDTRPDNSNIQIFRLG